MGDEAARHREYRRALKAMGICTVCRKTPARPNQTKCEACAVRQVKYMARLTKERAANRQCRSCGVELDEAIKMTRCPVCQERCRELIFLGRKL